MNKTDIDYVKARVNQVVLCTCGTITTKINKQIVVAALTKEEKIRLIREGKATLLTNQELRDGVKAGSWPDKDVALITCFTYPESEAQKQAAVHNKSFLSKLDEITQEVHLEGARLVDSIVMGIIDKTKLPDALKTLGEMASLV